MSGMWNDQSICGHATFSAHCGDSLQLEGSYRFPIDDVGCG